MRYMVIGWAWRRQRDQEERQGKTTGSRGELPSSLARIRSLLLPLVPKQLPLPGLRWMVRWAPAPSRSTL